ncbi:MAG: hypothetical protein ACE5JG_13435, partial [Planctomycetota bacterium]
MRTMGLTRFLGRLGAGEELRELREDLVETGVEAADVAARLGRLLPAVLRADGYDPRKLGLHGRAPLRTKVARVVRFLTEPPRDLEAFRLAGKRSKDPLLDARPVRVWTLGEAYPPWELRVARQNLEHIAGVAGVSIERGFDVVVTPGQGREAFPLRRPPHRAIGVYYLDDRYAAVRSTLPPVRRVEVLKHELVHAWCHRFVRVGSRFVAEGLAEYLRHCRPGDEGFRFPVDRLEDNLDALAKRLVLLREAGVDIRTVEPRLLVTLSPRRFYALGPLGYLLAQAAMAYVGADVLELALREGSDRRIQGAVAAIDWCDFLRFVERHAEHGSAADAMVVADPPPTAGRSRDRESRGALRDALRAIGMKVGPGDALEAAELDPTRNLSEPWRVAEVLELLVHPVASGEPLLLLTDRSVAMDRPVRPAAMDKKIRKARGGARRAGAT